MRTKGRASEAGVDFTAHSTARQMIWMPVKRCIRQVFTCQKARVSVCPVLTPLPHPNWTAAKPSTLLTKGTSGWYLGGLNRSKMRSKSWMPLRDVTPMYRKMPNSTDRGMRERIGSMRMDSPVRTDTLLVQVTRGSAPMGLRSYLGWSIKPQVPCDPFLQHQFIGSEGNNLEGYLSKESSSSLPYTHSPSLVGQSWCSEEPVFLLTLECLHYSLQKGRDFRENEGGTLDCFISDYNPLTQLDSVSREPYGAQRCSATP